jgi:hypothetical protein
VTPASSIAVNRLTDGSFVGNVENRGLRLVAFPPQGGDRLVRRGLISAIDDDDGASSDQTFGQRESDAARGAGEDRCVTDQIEQSNHLLLAALCSSRATRLAVFHATNLHVQPACVEIPTIAFLLR